MTLIESIAVIFGLLCVWLTIRQNIWCWPTGLIQVALYVFIFYRVKLYSDLILHVIYVILQIYGWHHWLRGGGDHGRLTVSRLPPRGFIGWILVATVGTAIWGWGMATFTDAAVPYWDAFITVASLIAQWLMTRKRLESWWFWISVDVVAIGVYVYKFLLMTSGLYAVFLVMATMGFFAWRRTIGSVTNEDGINTREVCPTPQGAPVAD
jgi:nicotinamide mononucleotide transporter